MIRSMFVKKIGIDLGTCNSVIFLPRIGIAIQEPSVVAVSLTENKILAVGKDAKEMLGRAPENIRIYRPLKDGVIADFRVTQAMIKHLLQRAIGRFRIFRPDLVIGIPVGATSTERRALIEAGKFCGAKDVFVVKEPILAALGAGIPIESYSGNLICDIGGGTTEVAIISLGGIVNWKSIRIGGDEMDLAIADYIKRKYNLAIGEHTAEEIKIKIGSAIEEKEKREMEVKGRDLILGLPRTIRVNSNEIAQVLSDILGEILQAIKSALRETPPELSADIMEKGMVLAGGGSLLRNFPLLVQKSLGIKAILPENPLLCVAKGTGIILENLDTYKKILLTKR